MPRPGRLPESDPQERAARASLQSVTAPEPLAASLSTFVDTAPEPPIRLRGLMWLSLSDIGHVVTAGVTPDTGGGAAQTWVAGTAVPCRIDPLTGNERLIADQIADQSTHIITFPPGTTVALVDRVSIDNRGTFEVTAVRYRTAERSVRVEVVQA